MMRLEFLALLPLASSFGPRAGLERRGVALILDDRLPLPALFEAFRVNARFDHIPDPEIQRVAFEVFAVDGIIH